GPLIQPGVLTQARWHQHATAAVHLQIHSVADQQTLQTPRLFTQRRQFTQLRLDLLPLGQGINAEAAIHSVDRDDQLAIATRNQLVTIPAWHGKPAFGVETDGVGSAKHGCASSELAIHAHYFPLHATFYHLCAL